MTAILLLAIGGIGFKIAALLAVFAFGIFTLTGGNFQLTGGGGPVANGSVVMTLSNPSATVIATGGAATPVYTFNLDGNGNFPAGTQAYANAELSPAGTFYTAQIFTGPNGTGTQVGQNATWIVGPSAPYVGTLYPNVLVLPPVSFAGALIVPRVVVSYSATPAFNAANGSIFEITLTGNVTSSTLTGMQAGQVLIFVITQDGVGGHTFVWPTSVHNPDLVDGAAGKKSIQQFYYDGSACWPISAMIYSN